ncbi:MAG TPA: carbon-nitrogen hydrolase family protein [Chthonomonadales bacterium]|nr:carbon-nitrogen hydrolase family protein [Chthonomonadales bacterium]
MRRHATLASVSKRPEWGISTPEDMARLLDDTATFVRRASRMGADILAFPEVYPQLRTTNFMAAVEPEDGGTLDHIRQLARENNIYIVWPRAEIDKAGQKHNAAVLVDRTGGVVGRYYKMFPTIDEMEGGIVPGTSCPIFQTDFGRVAMIICFDLNFIEIRDELREQRPDLVIFCSMYRGGQQCHEWALDLGCHMLTAIAAELGRIIDPGGKLLQLATYEALITQRVNLNKRQLHMDYNWQKMDEMLAKYGPDLTFEYYTPEARYVIGYEKEDRDVDEIVREFGLEQITDYFARARRVRKEKLEELG